MIAYIILFWICLQLSAPVWVYILFGIAAATQTASFAVKLYKAFKE